MCKRLVYLFLLCFDCVRLRVYERALNAETRQAYKFGIHVEIGMARSRWPTSITMIYLFAKKNIVFI